MENDSQTSDPALTQDPVTEYDPNSNEEIFNDESLDSSESIPKKGGVFEFFSDPKNATLVYSAIALVVIFAFIGLIFYVATDAPSSNEKETKELNTVEKKNEILSKIIQNNPKGIIANDDTFDFYTPGTGGNSDVPTLDPKTGTVTPATPTVVEPDPIKNAPIPTPKVDEKGKFFQLTAEEVVAPDLNKYNYRISKTTITPGSLATACQSRYGGGYYYTDAKRTLEYYEYFDTDKSYYKNLTIDKDGDIENYYLGLYGKNVNEFYNYAGGNIAARVFYQINPNFYNGSSVVTSYANGSPASYASSYPTSYSNGGVAQTISSYFGSNAVITDVIKEGDKTYYEITSTYSAPCSDEPIYSYWYLDTSLNRKFINIYKVDSESFGIVERSLYLDKVDDDYLVYNETNFRETRKVTIEEIEKAFKFDYDAEFVDVDYRTIESSSDYIAKVKDFVIQNGLDILEPNVPNPEYLDATYLSIRNEPLRTANQDYYLRREYYHPSEKGQLKFDRLMLARKKAPEANYSLWDKNNKLIANYYWINQYNIDDGNTVENIYNRTVTNYGKLVSELPGNIVVNGEEIEGKIVLTRYEVPSSYASSYPVSFGVTKESAYLSSYVVTSYLTNQRYYLNSLSFIFEYDNKVWQVSPSSNYYNLAWEQYSSFLNNFIHIDGSQESSKDALLNFIDEAYSSHLN